MSNISNNDSIHGTNNEEKQQKIALPENAPCPRLCHLKKWLHFQGYGFNLHAERSKMGQHIGKVDIDSPAESAGLREGDRIIEVNYVNISNENHQQVVKRIRNGFEDGHGKLNEDEVILLVVDAECDEFYKKLNLVVKSDFENILKLKTASPEVQSVKKEREDLENTLNNDMNSNINDDINNMSKISGINTSSSNSEEGQSINIYNKNNDSNNIIDVNTSIIKKDERLRNEIKLESTSISPTSSEFELKKNSDTQSKSKVSIPLNESSKNITYKESNDSSNLLKTDPYQMSAAEFKSYLKSKGRNDPRITPADMKQKYELFQNM